MEDSADGWILEKNKDKPSLGQFINNEKTA